MKLFTTQIFPVLLYFTLLGRTLSHQNTGAAQVILQLVHLLLIVRLGFIPGGEHVGFVMNKVALEQAVLQELWFSLPVIISPVLHSHPSSVVGTEGSFLATAPGDPVLPHGYN